MEKIVPKIGIFIWNQGGRLSQAVDLEGLVKKFSKAKNAARCEFVDELWTTAFFDSLRSAVENKQIDRFLWVGRFTSYQMKYIKGQFSAAGLNPYLHEWVDLEDQGICLKDTAPEIRAAKAASLIQMALARNRLLEPLNPMELPASDAILIIGAGVAGLHAAESLSALGKQVHLVEKESGVGGKVALLSRFYPRICDPHCGLEFTLQKLSESDHVAFHTLSRVEALSGSPGNYMAAVQKKPRYVSETKCNACGECLTVCPKEIPGAFPVSETMKAIHSPFPMSFPSAFVVEREHCPPECRECEKICPAKAVDLNQAPSEDQLRVGAVLITTGWDLYPLSKVEEYGYGRFDNIISNLEMEQLLSSHTRQPGKSAKLSLNDLKEVGFIQCAGSRDERHLPYCSSVCCSATLKQILYFKELVPEAKCYVFYQHIRSSGFEEDLYRKAREMGDVTFVRERPATVALDEQKGKLNVTVLDPLLDKEITMDLDLLVLAGGMCPSQGTRETAQVLKLPQNHYQFFESHLQCHPEEGQRTGIYVGGSCREPMNVSQSIDSSHRSAMQALKYLAGTVLIEPTYPVVNKTKCDQCKRCMEECPFSSFVFDEKEFPTPDLARCRQCGNCMGICPLAVISLNNNTIKQMAVQIEAVNTSFMGKKEPVILALLCENDAYKAARAAVDQGLPVPPNAIIIKVSCAGSVNNAVIADALSLGIDGILIGGCKDDQCHYVKGSQLVQKRSGDLSDKLKTMMIEPERVRFVNLEIRDANKYVEVLNTYIHDLKAMGPNPFKI
ncbi:MAG: hydrogenase iron-sulfur subunit [Thermodesulfobacteriota bacterium]